MQTNETLSNNSNLARLVDCLNEDEFATLAGVKTSTLKAWRKRGKGPEYVLLGCNYLYPIPAIQEHVTQLTKSRFNVDARTVLQ